jgi:hypothetical protein
MLLVCCSRNKQTTSRPGSLGPPDRSLRQLLPGAVLAEPVPDTRIPEMFLPTNVTTGYGGPVDHLSCVEPHQSGLSEPDGGLYSINRSVLEGDSRTSKFIYYIIALFRRHNIQANISTLLDHIFVMLTPFLNSFFFCTQSGQHNTIHSCMVHR